MDIAIALAMFGVGLGLIMFFAEQLVKGVVGTSIGFGPSTFLLSVMSIGFDPDNLAVGVVASADGMAGIALGSILGGAMVAVALAFGMTVLAFLVSIEELARELPAGRQGRPDIGFGNGLGSILAFFLCNAGVIALVRPVPVDTTALTFYLPLAFITTAMVSGVMLTKRVPRWAGGGFIPLYAVFVLCGWFM
jgi:Ca2+/Na+ antiporter